MSCQFLLILINQIVAIWLGYCLTKIVTETLYLNFVETNPGVMAYHGLAEAIEHV